MEFPYPFRPHQEEIVALVAQAAAGGHLVFQAGTGSGKTVCALVGALEEAADRDKVVLYLVRTHAQQRQVLLELRKLGAFGVALQGRQRTCLLARERALGPGTPEELSHFCRTRKEEVHQGREGCAYYRGLLEGDLEAVASWWAEALPTAEEATARFRRQTVCPYELTKALAPRARVVTAPYVYFFDPLLRRTLLETLARPVEDLILVVDEAHNLPDHCRDLGSFRLSQGTVERAQRELMEYGDPEVAEGTSAFDLLEVLARAVRDLCAEHVEDEDGFLPPSALEAELLSAFAVTTRDLRAMVARLLAAGEAVRQARTRAGQLPRSALRAVAWNLRRWTEADETAYARLARGGAEPALEAFCLDPARVAEPLQACQGSVHMSGTLEPLEAYRDVLGLPAEAVLRTFPSPFPPEHRRVVYREGVTTRHQDLQGDPDALARLRDEVARLLRGCRRNTLFLFPSYRLLDAFADLAAASPVPVYRERRGMDQAALMGALDRFRRRPGAFFAVAGGRVAEGLDFPDRELEVVVLVGIPYPKPTAATRALVTYYDGKFGKGWEYAVLAPTARRLLQGVGRLIRSASDRGVAVILDRRAPYFKRFLGPLVPVREPRRIIEDHLGGATRRAEA